MNQMIWGSHGWMFLHTITFNYPVKPKQCDKNRFRRFFAALKDVIPCKTCRDNYESHLTEFPIKLDSREELVKWLIDVHNSVNGKTGKRQYSYDEVIKEYEQKLDKQPLLTLTGDNELCRNDEIIRIIKQTIAVLFVLVVICYIIVKM